MKWLRRIRTALIYSVASLVVALAAIWLALLVAPGQSLIAAGQPIMVGAAPPTLSLSGPGRIDVFGQTLSTVPQFQGPIRPLLKLDESHLALNDQLGQLFQPGTRS